MGFHEPLRHALHDYAPGVHEAGPPLSPAALQELERRLGQPLPQGYRDFLGSFDGATLFTEQIRLFAAADPELSFVSAPPGALRIGEGPEGAFLLLPSGAVLLVDEAQPDAIVAGTDLERFLAATLTREGLLVDREGEYRDVFDEEGALKAGVRRRRIQAGRKHDPGAALYLLEEAELHFEEHQTGKALAALRKAVAQDPAAGAAWELLSALLREDPSQHAEAAEAARRAAQATPHAFLRASRLLDAAELSTAGDREARLREAAAADPSHAATLLREAEEILASGDPEDRVQTARLAARLRLLLSAAAESMLTPSPELLARAEVLARTLRIRSALQVV